MRVHGAEPSVGESVLEEVCLGLAQWEGVRVTKGKEVIELAVIETDKVEALDMLRRQAYATAALFVGHDVTAEKAFALWVPRLFGTHRSKECFADASSSLAATCSRSSVPRAMALSPRLDVTDGNHGTGMPPIGLHIKSGYLQAVDLRQRR